jgi:hypothetical protein
MIQRNRIAMGVVFLVAASAGCSLFGGGGLESKECKDYFAKVDECVGKAKAKGTPAAKIKADAWRQGADTSKQNFEKNSNPLAVKKSCEMMMTTLKDDADCR